MNGSLTRWSIATMMTMALVACSQAPAGSGAATGTPAAAAAATATPTAAPTATPSPTPAPTARATPVIVTVTPIPDAPDSGIVVNLVAKNSRWVPNELTAPAGMVWYVELDNQDPVDQVHNFVVASGRTLGQRIFMSERFYGGTVSEFAVPALPAGAYLFICRIHANQMTSELIIN